MVDEQGVTIFLAEDNPGHVRLIEKNLMKTKRLKQLVKFSNGAQLLEYLFQRNIDLPKNLLILLDLEMPERNGYEVLKCVKRSKQTRHVPVVIFSVSDEPDKIARCYELGCNLYATKPLEHRQFSEAVSRLSEFCLMIKLPERNAQQ